VTTHEVYNITATPGANPQHAAARLASYIVNRWMPGNAGGVHVLITPKLASILLQFFARPKPTVLEVNTVGLTPVITEKQP
jgi:hypothetical protein